MKLQAGGGEERLERSRPSPAHAEGWVGTYSLFFSLTLAPLRSSSSVTCFLLGWGEATAQCWKTAESFNVSSRAQNQPGPDPLTRLWTRLLGLLR